MSKFSYHIWDEDVTLLSPKSLRLSLIGDMLCCLLDESDRDDEKNKCQCSRCRASLNYSYYDAFLELIDNCDIDSDNDGARKEVTAALADIKVNAQSIRDKFNRHDYPRAATAERLEMKEFFSHLAKEYVDDYKETTKNYIKLKDENHPRFTFTSSISLEGHKWEFSIPVSDVVNDIHLSIDGKDIDTIDGYDINRISVLFQVLTNVSLEREAEKMAVERFINEADNKDDLISKSKAMASILGGSYENYVAITSFTMMQKAEKTPMSEKEQLTGFFMHEHRADISAVKEAVKIFLDKPMYH